MLLPEPNISLKFLVPCSRDGAKALKSLGRKKKKKAKGLVTSSKNNLKNCINKNDPDYNDTISCDCLSVCICVCRYFNNGEGNFSNFSEG